jgi:3,4-dihydroxy 2-butanone 4-phosphate synthase/GTP cyclohydrolase II
MIPIENLLQGAGDHRHATGRPWVTLSYAQSLDGSLTARRGSPFSLSGGESLTLTHRLRAAHDAVLVGIGTVLADDPKLTVRLVEGSQPLPVILDSHLRCPPQANLLKGSRRPCIAALEDAPGTRKASLEAAGAQVLRFSPDEAGRIRLPALLECLAGLGINSLMVEGGGEVISAFLSQRLVDQVVLTIAPLFLGGYRSVGQDVSVPPVEQGHGAAPVYPRLRDAGSENLGDDLIVWGRLNSNSLYDLPGFD